MLSLVASHDGKRAVSLVEQRKETDQVNTAASDFQVIIEQRIVHTGRAQHHVQKNIFGQSKTGVCGGTWRSLVVPQYRVIQIKILII